MAIFPNLQGDMQMITYILSGLITFLITNTAYAEEAAQAVLKIDTGDTAWLLVASALVVLMTIPGLALFYGGLSKRKDALNTMAMSVAAFVIVSVLWIIYGYTLSFSGDTLGFVGDTAKLFLAGVGVSSISDAAKTIPELVFIVFQMTFAAITVALVSGAYIERMKFSAWLAFCVLWFTFVYIPVAHWVWGGGFCMKLGALDFAGGTVVHINAGIAALVGALYLGRRTDMALKPHNLTLVVLGTGLLWFGWFGFNAGSALAANGLAGMAFLNTNTAAAAAALAWMAMDWLFYKKCTVLGMASGAVAGLVGITPAAGFVDITGALVIGMAVGVIPFLIIAKIKPRLGYDDTLDAFGIHGVAGFMGAILTGILANPAVNEAGKGVIYGNSGQLMTQLIAAAATFVYSGIVTLVILVILKATMGIRAENEEEIRGLDETQHGETAYFFL